MLNQETHRGCCTASLHPVRNPRFASFRTQPLENLSAAVKLPIKKRFLGNPTLGTNLGSRILATRTGCISLPPCSVAVSAGWQARAGPGLQYSMHAVPADAIGYNILLEDTILYYTILCYTILYYTILD